MIRSNHHIPDHHDRRNEQLRAEWVTKQITCLIHPRNYSASGRDTLGFPAWSETIHVWIQARKASRTLECTWYTVCRLFVLYFNTDLGDEK